jgi:hypothetical protein
MKINLSIIISFIVLLFGFFAKESFLWIPLTVLITGVIDLLTRRWVISNKLGSAKNLSAIVKLLLTLIGFYAMIGQFVCVLLLIWWLIF